MNKKVDPAFRKATLWQEEAQALREVLLGCDLVEELKWGKPCYTSDGRNIVIIQRMKDFLALMFFKGALLKDPQGVLERQGPNSRSGFRMRFTSVEEVDGRADIIRAYIREAVQIEKDGKTVEKAAGPELPEELLRKFKEDPDLKTAFGRLTPGRQRGYALYFSDAKQSKTRVARIEKSRARILDGKGIHDR